jgi:hypothetical protein
MININAFIITLVIVFAEANGSSPLAMEISSQKRWIKYGRLLLSVSF